MLLTKEQILKASDRKVITVDVPEWGGTVRMQEFSGKAREEYITVLQAKHKGAKDGNIDVRGLTCMLLSLTLVNEDNAPLFSVEELDALGSKSATVLDRLFEQAMIINGLDGKATDTALKNS